MSPLFFEAILRDQTKIDTQIELAIADLYELFHQQIPDFYEMRHRQDCTRE